MSRLHKPKAGFWIRLAVVILYPLDALLYRIKWRHLDRVPAPSQGGCIIAINHISHVDTVLMARLVWQSGRIPRFMIKASLFDKPVIGRVFKGAHQIPVYRGTADAAESLRDAAAALDRGECIVIYPEGTITKDPAKWPMQGKTGIARLVLLRPEVPVVPVGQWGAQRFNPLKRPTCGALVGEPLDLSRYHGVEETAETLRTITDVVMSAVRDQVALLRGTTAPRTFHVPAKKYVDKAS